MHAYICIHTCIHMHMAKCIHTYLRTYIHMHKYVLLHTQDTCKHIILSQKSFEFVTMVECVIEVEVNKVARF